MMKPRNLVILAALAALVIYGWWGNHSERHAPAGQPALVMLNAANLAEFQRTFNDDAAHPRVILLPSPT